MRDSVGGLVYPLNAFWEYTRESPKNEFFIVNILAGYLGEKARAGVIIAGHPRCCREAGLFASHP